MSKNLVNMAVRHSFPVRREEESGDVRVRFAPSPTGYLHIGGLRTALFNWLFAKNKGGTFLVRIEDTDFERNKPEYNDAIINSLSWASLVSDEPLVYQSHRLKEYQKVTEQLIKEGKAYKCYCSVEDLKIRLNSEEEYKKYDNNCRNRKDTNSASQYVIRFKLPDNVDLIEYQDLIRGNITFDTMQFDDFIIMRPDGVPTYNFAVVVDDHYMKISHILRGEEHILNTPKQILIYQALGYAMPLFGHFSVILAPDGSKLSKRSGATSVEEYRKAGFLADALCNYLVRLGWSHGDQEIFTREELVKLFSLDHVVKKGAIFDIKKLEWLNGVYIKNSSAENLLCLIKADVESDFEEHFQAGKVKWDKEKILQLIDLYKSRCKTLAELAFECKSLYWGPKDFSSLEFLENIEVNNALEKLDKSVIDYLDQLIKKLTDLKEFNYDTLSNEIKNFCRELNIKMPEIAMPIRIALTGNVSTPGIIELMVLIGKKETLKMIDNFKNYLRLNRSPNI